jgi:hypothetical protein
MREMRGHQPFQEAHARPSHLLSSPSSPSPSLAASSSSLSSSTAGGCSCLIIRTRQDNRTPIGAPMKDIPALLLAQHLIREANCCMRRPIWVRRTRRWMEAVPSRKHQHWTDRHIGKNHDILHDERLVKDHRAIARGIIPGGIYPPGKRFAVPKPASPSGCQVTFTTITTI